MEGSFIRAYLDHCTPDKPYPMRGNPGPISDSPGPCDKFETICSPTKNVAVSDNLFGPPRLSPTLRGPG